MIHSSQGILEYGPGIKVAVMVDKDIGKYYRKLLPKYYYAQPPMYSPHITVVRTDKETPKNMDVWNKYAGEVISFTYDNEVKTDGTYFYLRAYSDRVGDIREELGLPRFRFNDLEKNSYHITIGNSKNT